MGFMGVLCLLVLVTLLPLGVLVRPELAGLRQPSMAGALAAVVGPWGLKFVSAGLIVSVLGAYLAWSLPAAEALYSAANFDELVKSRKMPFFVIPAKAGIKLIQDVLDPGFRRGDDQRDFLRTHQFWAGADPGDLCPGCEGVGPGYGLGGDRHRAHVHALGRWKETPAALLHPLRPRSPALGHRPPGEGGCGLHRGREGALRRRRGGRGLRCLCPGLRPDRHKHYFHKAQRGFER